MFAIVSGHLEVLYGGEKGQKKQFCSDDEKRSICGQARVSGVSVAQIARQ